MLQACCVHNSCHVRWILSTPLTLILTVSKPYPRLRINPPNPNPIYTSTECNCTLPYNPYHSQNLSLNPNHGFLLLSTPIRQSGVYGSKGNLSASYAWKLVSTMEGKDLGTIMGTPYCLGEGVVRAGSKPGGLSVCE